MIYPMKVQLNSIEKRKISHFFSVLFRSAGRMSIMIAGRPTIKVQNVKPNPMLESSPITPSKNHPKDNWYGSDGYHDEVCLRFLFWLLPSLIKKCCLFVGSLHELVRQRNLKAY